MIERPVPDGLQALLSGPWGQGVLAASHDEDRCANPYPIESQEWQRWLEGFQAWTDAPKITLEWPDSESGESA